MNNTIENNRLIRTFMGLIPKIVAPDVYSYNDGVFFTSRGSLESVSKSMDEYVKYHSSWDWLMKVVKEIELHPNSDKFGNFTFYGLGRTKVQCYDKNQNGGQLLHIIDIIGKDYGIAPTYNACIEFIKWYNQQSK